MNIISACMSTSESRSLVGCSVARRYASAKNGNFHRNLETIFRNRASSSLGGSWLEIGRGCMGVRDGDGVLGFVRMGVSERWRRREDFVLHCVPALGAQRELRRSPILGITGVCWRRFNLWGGGGFDGCGGDIVHGPLGVYCTILYDERKRWCLMKVSWLFQWILLFVYGGN